MVQVTTTQYARLVDAISNWPDRLLLGSLEEPTPNGPKRCTQGYLAHRATGNAYADMSEVSQFYGIPESHLYWTGIQNDFLYLFGERIRARGMLRRHQRFLNKVKVVPEPKETTDIISSEQQEVYVTR